MKHTLTPQERDRIVDAIARFVPEELFVQIVESKSVVPNIRELQKTTGDATKGRYDALVGTVVEIYDIAGRLRELLTAFYEKVTWSVGFRQIISEFLDLNLLQATHRLRDHFIHEDVLVRLSQEFSPRVACIVGERIDNQKIATYFGTGFLVAPDLLLTSGHVFEPAINQHGLDWIPQHCAVYFDYSASPPIQSWQDTRNDVRRVELVAENWLVEFSPSAPNEGLINACQPGRPEQLMKHLDFALVRLKETVGLDSAARSGGRRREWIRIPDKLPLLGIDSFVNIAQHPAGLPRRLGIGRYGEPCKSLSRLWYDTEADNGSSGAPCLTRELVLVGIHNAAYHPPGEERKYNQAVRIDVVWAKVRHIIEDALSTLVIPPPTAIWNVSVDPEETKIVLGREAFGSWLSRAFQDSPARKSDRVYAAESNAASSGKTFSLEILTTHLRGQGDHKIVIFGSELERLPSNVEDFLRVLMDHLRIPPAEIEKMPKRPAADLPEGALDGDKLRRWASVTVPAWFATTIQNNAPPRRDLRADALRRRRELRDNGEPIPEDVDSMADQPEPVWISDGWKIAWVALDSLDKSPISQELLDLIAGLSGAASDEAILAAELKRLRWIFLGQRPDFFARGDVTVETLDPLLIGSEELEAVLRDALSSRTMRSSEAEWTDHKRKFGEFLAKIDKSGLKPEQRLIYLQTVVSLYIDLILEKGR